KGSFRCSFVVPPAGWQKDYGRQQIVGTKRRQQSRRRHFRHAKFHGNKACQKPDRKGGQRVHVQRWTITPLALPYGRASDTICFYSLYLNGATLLVARSSQQFRDSISCFRQARAPVFYPAS